MAPKLTARLPPSSAPTSDHGLLALVVVSLISCAAPSRQLSPRVVEDPIVLPRRMVSLSVTPSVYRTEPTEVTRGSTRAGLRVGVTDRLEWTDLLSLRFAFLDDAPATTRARAPFSLAVRGGALGFGFSSAEGVIVLPLLSVEALKHVADRWAFSLSAQWQATWVEKPATWITSDGTLYTARRRWSHVDLDAGALRQVTERVALGIGAAIGQVQDCVDALCPWTSRDARARVRLFVRPRPWMTLALFPSVGLRYRPATLAPQSPVDPIVPQPRMAHWLGITGSVAFFW